MYTDIHIDIYMEASDKDLSVIFTSYSILAPLSAISSGDYRSENMN